MSQEAIEFVTPALYLTSQDPQLMKREEELRRRLTCILGRDNASESFIVVRELPSVRVDRPSWESTVDAWLAWFSDCVTR